MKITSYLEDMPSFQEASNNAPCIVHPKTGPFEAVIKEWSEFIVRQFEKKLVPLFITGSGISMGQVWDMQCIIKELRDQYNKIRESIAAEIREDIDRLFKTLDTCDQRGNSDRSVVGRILNEFQNNKSSLHGAWQTLNANLLWNVIEADPTSSHNIIAKLYDDAGAICLTLNFDGLLINLRVQSSQ